MRNVISATILREKEGGSCGCGRVEARGSIVFQEMEQGKREQEKRRPPKRR